MSSNKLELKLLSKKSAHHEVILISLTNHHNEELRVNIVQVRIKRQDALDFVCISNRFKIIASVTVDHTFRIDLDPHETREYGILVDDGSPPLEGSFDFEIVARDQRFGFESSVQGHQDGFDIPSGFSQAANKNETRFSIGKTVIAKNRSGGKEHVHLTISVENGTENDFGIFDKHQINPTAAYIALGRDGYRELKGKHVTILDWDRDTMASPPDLFAVHVTNTATKEHGWYFRKDLVLLDE